VAASLPFAADRVDTVARWDDVKLLTVQVDRLERWHRPGLLCIGDAAHAMSPVGGVGINLAIQDAVAAANRLWRPLRDGEADEAVLASVQRRRMWPTRMTQRLQLAIQNRIIARVLERDAPLPPPLALRLLRRFPVLTRVPARLIGLGFRPEHIRSPDVSASGHGPAATAGPAAARA
jgi:2-polyprenyl-6-methoxyphenol hydroxylase-like FAD-dependent oxidoreductase